MTAEERRARFRLVRPPERMPLEEAQFYEAASQQLLFPLPKPDLLIFVLFPLVTADEFTKAVELAKPSAVLDLRRSPRFDVGHLNRKQALRSFQDAGAKYFDVFAMEASGQKESTDPVQLAESYLSRSGMKLSGPIMLLLSDSAIPDDGVPVRIARLFAAASQHPWETIEIPRFA